MDLVTSEFVEKPITVSVVSVFSTGDLFEFHGDGRSLPTTEVHRRHGDRTDTRSGVLTVPGTRHPKKTDLGTGPLRNRRTGNTPLGGKEEVVSTLL